MPVIAGTHLPQGHCIYAAFAKRAPEASCRDLSVCDFNTASMQPFQKCGPKGSRRELGIAVGLISVGLTHRDRPARYAYNVSVVQTFRKVIGEGSIGRVHLGRWQETDVAIKVLGHVAPHGSIPQAASMGSSSHMSAIDEGGSNAGATDDDDSMPMLGDNMALTIKTLEREVCDLLLTLGGLSCNVYEHHPSCRT